MRNMQGLLVKTQCAVLLLCLSLVGGCPQRDSLAVLTETLGNAVAALVAAAGNTELAEKLRHDTGLAVGLIQDLKPGASPAEAIRAVNALIDDLKSFPASDRFKPLVTFALGTAAAIIEALSKTGPGEPPHTDVRLTAPPHDAREFRQSWDAIRAGSPGLEAAPIL